MSTIAKQITEMVGMLPDKEQSLAFELVKRLVLAWDPDYTKTTPSEAALHDAAMEAYRRGEYVRHEDIKWD